MAEFDPFATHRDLTSEITSELRAAGFEDAEEIGRGGFGVVYRCAQPALDRVVAVKVLTADLTSDNLERFLREQKAMGRLSGHPHIVNLLEVGTMGGVRPYIVMQYHPHGSLDGRIRRHGPLDWTEALCLGVKMAGALETAHRLGTLHRDVKPANILLTAYGEPQLTDFGIARIAGAFRTATGMVTGSPAFTAPEVLEGRAPSVPADVYGLGATLFCAITGHAAFERNTGEQVVTQFLRITSQPIPDLRGEGIPDDLCAAIERAMAGNPADRLQSAAELGDELRAVQIRHNMAVDEMALPTEPGGEQRVDAYRTGTAPRAGGPRSFTSGARKRSSTTISPPAPVTKYHPPTSTKTLVTRGRLIDLLRAGQGRRLTVIHGPTGFGKSTLAAQWRDALVADGVAVAWLTVDHDDNNVVWFLTHLIEAIREVRPTLADHLGQALEEHGDEAERYVLTSLMNEIHGTGERVAVVIDDWHRVTGAATIAALRFLLDNGCHHLQLIVTTRSPSGLPLSRMRVRDELIEIDSAALRFDSAESRSFLVDVGGLDLRPEEVAALAETTDGWVAALQLAWLSLRGSEDLGRLIGDMAGRTRGIGEFLAENVLDTIEPAMLDFLEATSITERICGSLADALARTDHGQAMLEEIEERDLFLRRIDAGGRWFRYHRLFASYLRLRLARDRPERFRELHRAASRWFADHRFLNEAVDHALAAHDENRALDLVEANGAYLQEHSQMATLLGIIAKLPEHLVAARPRLQLSIGWADVLLQRPVPARTALRRFESAVGRSAVADSEATNLRAEAAVLTAVVEVAADRVDAVDQLVADALARPEALPPRTVVAAANAATFAAIYRFDFDAARRLQRQAIPYHELSGPFGLVYGRCFAGIAATEQLHIDEAMEIFRGALHIAGTSAGAQSHAARLAGALLGDLLYVRGELDEAARLLDESYELGPEGGAVDFMIARYATGARIKAAQGDFDTAIKRLNDGARTAQALALPRLHARIVNERIKLGLPLGPSDRVRFRPPPESGPQGNGIRTVTAEIEEDSEIRLLLADSADRNARACTRAQALRDSIDGAVRPRAALQADLLRVACLWAAGQAADAKAIVVPVAATCEKLGLVRLLHDGGPRVRSAVRALGDDQRNHRWPADRPHIPFSFLNAVLAR